MLGRAIEGERAVAGVHGLDRGHDVSGGTIGFPTSDHLLGPAAAVLVLAGYATAALLAGLNSRSRAWRCSAAGAFMIVSACPNASDAPKPLISW
ncbi:MAG TPA: hypothetical protein VHY31_07410 [Streptosporangiaceae bacterium]|nr:hypothetical protein [Streptosporangiaceae bacterium]